MGRLATLVLAFFILSGCAGNRIDYNLASSALKLGMSKAQVRKILGEPRRTEVNTEREKWVYWGKTTIGLTSIDNEMMASDRLVTTFKNGQLTAWGNQTFQSDALEMSAKMMENMQKQPLKVQIEQVN